MEALSQKDHRREEGLRRLKHPFHDLSQQARDFKITEEAGELLGKKTERTQ